MTRPLDLPDFLSPPLNEVVIGIQFNAIRGYQQIFAKDVWELFSSDFPRVQEQPALPPSFETFGLPSRPQINFGIMTGAQPNRFWFLTEDEEELIQFQQDRFLHNWRKVGDQSNEYPRFEKMIDNFKSEALRLSEFFHSRWSESPKINQCEITYINHIGYGSSDRTNPGEWLNFVSFYGELPEDFNLAFRRTIHDGDGKPRGRFIVEANSALNGNGKRIIVLTLTVRGAPKQPNLDSALEFLNNGREIVVKSFADLTTESAHRTWERIS
ncbi:MAG: TIGR04255 family protein [Rhizobiaceae bacterium]|jgi:uncharacterized protein (TIGR04255 family)